MVVAGPELQLERGEAVLGPGERLGRDLAGVPGREGGVAADRRRGIALGAAALGLRPAAAQVGEGGQRRATRRRGQRQGVAGERLLIEAVSLAEPFEFGDHLDEVGPAAERQRHRFPSPTIPSSFVSRKSAISRRRRLPAAVTYGSRKGSA